MSAPVLVALIVAAVVAHFLARNIGLGRKAQRDALPTNHPSYRPLTDRERRRYAR